MVVGIFQGKEKGLRLFNGFYIGYRYRRQRCWALQRVQVLKTEVLGPTVHM